MLSNASSWQTTVPDTCGYVNTCKESGPPFLLLVCEGMDGVRFGATLCIRLCIPCLCMKMCWCMLKWPDRERSLPPTAPRGLPRLQRAGRNAEACGLCWFAMAWVDAHLLTFRMCAHLRRIYIPATTLMYVACSHIYIARARPIYIV